ncbi:MAG: hypothetical protein JWO46_1571, partial [Nocardioidaceae bacterium]|nr:hypothetical protein [Nocardioidaceae bacterium]
SENGFLAALEAGQLPEALVEHADEAGIELLPGAADLETACACGAWTQPCPHAVALLQQLAWHVDRDPYVLLLLRGRTREWLVEEVTARHDLALHDLGLAERGDAADRAAAILALAAEAPTGHGLADSGVAGYDEAVSRLLAPPGA